jgi:DNA helicase-2/ATP-dependent DNA helicase PcrA
MVSILNHPDYSEELQRLTYTLDYLRGYNENVEREKSRVDKDVDYGMKHYNSDNAEQFNDLVINKALKESLTQKLKDVDKSLLKPYFARVDFLEQGTSDVQKLYIGKMSLLRDKDQETIIIDWRAPIATLYYEGRLGEAGFESLEGKISGDIKLKRQYSIEQAELKEIYDIDITTNDDFLQAALGSSKDNRLKDIVSTIQAEQNRVIRADMWKPLIVQGAAGGGKTTIALHRIAYLLYNYGKTLTAKNFMIIAPNTFFLSYISEVLPDLGVENVIQTTFEDFAINIIGKKYKILSANEKLAALISSRGKNNIIKDISKFKSSMDLKIVIDSYLKQVEDSFIPKEDFKLDSYILLTYEEINSFFINEYNNLPMTQRILEIKKTLVNTLKYKKNPILEEVEKDYDRKIDEVRDNMDDCPERRKAIIELTEKRDAHLKKIKDDSKTIVKDYISKCTTVTTMEHYKALFGDDRSFCELTKGIIDEKRAQQVRDETLAILDNNSIEVEDLAPLMYIKHYIHGLDEKIEVRHVVIDEAQDYSLFQLFILKKIIGGNSFSILGDLCQGIYSYRGINDWQAAAECVFGTDNFDFLTLEQSYRTTIEIMDAANSVIKYLNNPSLQEAKPVIRHGDEVKTAIMEDMKEVCKAIAENIENIKNEHFKSAAIICKTVEECKKMKEGLKRCGHDIQIITGKEKEYSGGIVLIPSYLVKGLEFDVVIIANASKEQYTTEELDVKLLYIAMTRPLHRLYIYSIGEKAKMLK